MAGALLDGVLPYVYSRANALKRGLSDLVANPLASMDRGAGLLADNVREQERLDALAFGDPKNPLRVTNQAAMGQAASNLMGGMLGFAPAGITAWHGSPHVFDRFDSSKIGTGEGAQAYGHGLYLAEAPEVAKQYADNVKDMGAIQNINAELSRLAKVMAADEVPGAYGKYKTDAGRQAAAQYESLMAQRTGVTKAPGALYKVDLPDDAVAKMLDYDKPVSEPVRERLSQAAMEKFGSGVSGSSGRQAYQTLVWEFKNAGSQNPAADATEFLRQQGISGMQYLDAGSRSAGQGSRNFVIFPQEENILRILERNGQPLK